MMSRVSPLRARLLTVRRMRAATTAPCMLRACRAGLLRGASTIEPRAIGGIRAFGSSSTKNASSSQPPNGRSSLWEDAALRRNVGILVGSQVLLNVGVSQVVPVLPILADEMNLGGTGMGMLMASPSVARLALNLPLGTAADTVGRRPLMQWGTLVTASGAVGTGLMMHSGLPAVCAARLLVGAGSAASMTGSTAMMQDLTDTAPQHRATILGLQSFILSGVWVVGPALGGWLAETYGAQNSFYLAGCGIALCSIGYSRLPETLRKATAAPASTAAAALEASTTTPAPLAKPSLANPANGGVKGQPLMPAEMKRLLCSPNVQALSALATATALSQACFMAVLTLHARHEWGATAVDLGLMFSTVGVSNLAGMPVGSWLANQTRRKALIVPGFALSYVTFGGLAFVSEWESFYSLLVLSYFSSACVSPSLSAFTAEVLPPTSRGQAMSISRMCSDGAHLGAPVALGMLADLTSCGSSIVTTAGLCGGCTILFALRAREPTLGGGSSSGSGGGSAGGSSRDGSSDRSSDSSSSNDSDKSAGVGSSSQGGSSSGGHSDGRRRNVGSTSCRANSSPGSLP